MEAPREPHRTPVRQARLDRQDRPRLYLAYLLKVGLRVVFQLPAAQAPDALHRSISWARHCRSPAFVQLQQRIVKRKASILAAIEHGMSNVPMESVHTKIQVLTRIAFGFGIVHSLIALAMLGLGGHQPSVPGRN